MKTNGYLSTTAATLRNTALAAAGLLALAAGGCSRQTPVTHTPPPAPSAVPADVLATIGDETITAEQFSAAMARRKIGDDPKAKRLLLDEMIHFRSLVQEAKRRGYDQNPQMKAAFENMLANRVRETEEEKIRDQIKVSPAEIAAFYNAHTAEYTVPGKIRAAMIFVEAPATFSAEAKTERRASIDAARAKALALPPDTAGFGAAAAEYSYDQATKYIGGDMGYLTEGATLAGWEKPLLEAATALTEVGKVSEVVTTERGFYLVKLTAKQAGSVYPLASVSARIERHLAGEKERQLAADTAKDAVARQPVKIFDDRLSAVSVPNTAKVERVAESTPPPVPGE